MTTITSYAELKQNIQDYAKRSDILNKLELFIDLAEADIWEVLRVREMEARAQATMNTTSRFETLPDQFIKMRKMQILVNDCFYDMNWKDIKNMQVLDTAGVPFEYTVTSELQFNRVADQAYTLEMEYYRELTPLSDLYPANDVLRFYPMVYLSGCMVHFSEWAIMPDKVQYWASIFDREISRANRKSRQGRYGPAPASSVQGMIV